jgi:hypothetical protein
VGNALASNKTWGFTTVSQIQTGSWTTQTSGTNSILYGVHFVDANTAWVVGLNGTILKYSP